MRIAAEIPAPEEHRARIRRAHAQLAAPDTSLHKVVLARALRLVADAPLDGRVILARLLAADPAAYGYLVDLTAAGGEYSGAALVGASPELLVARDGERVICQPFAGSAPLRRRGPRRRDRLGIGRVGQGSSRTPTGRRRRAGGSSSAVPADDDPGSARLRRTAAVWHLCTPITARINDISTTALDLALALHPTPAVGGVPADVASNLIATLEGDRGFYAGAVGWCDGHGNGEWVVSIRCAQLAPTGAAPSSTPVAGSSPNQIPMTNLTKRP